MITPQLQTQLDKGKLVFRVEWMAWLIITAGLVLRLIYYFYNRPLWGDEAAIAVNIIEKDFLALAKPPLLYDQQAPLLFLYALKLCTVFSKNFSEQSLRFFPLVCGLLANILFWPLAKKILPKLWALIAVICFSFGSFLIYYSAEVKQYQTEVLANILAYLLYFEFNNKQALAKRILWGLSGGLLLWLSHSVLFTLATLACISLYTELSQRKWSELKMQLIVCTFWFISFIINYTFIISHGAHIEWLTEFWRNKQAFIPFPPRNLSDILWFPLSFMSIISMPLGMKWEFLSFGFKLNAIPLLFFCIGSIILFIQNKELFLILLMPLILLLIASSVGKYPFSGRLVLFYTPVIILVIVNGIRFLFGGTVKYTAGGAFLLPLLILIPIVYNSLKLLIHPVREQRSYLREALLYVAANKQPGDIIYLDGSLVKVYRYYRNIYNISSWKVVTGSPAFITVDENTSLYSLVNHNKISWLNREQKVWVISKEYSIIDKKSIDPGSNSSDQSDIAANIILKQGKLVQKKSFAVERVYLLESF
jgi:hypothetical protein